MARGGNSLAPQLRARAQALTHTSLLATDRHTAAPGQSHAHAALSRTQLPRQPCAARSGRGLRQIDFAQRSGIPTSNPTITGSSNTANYFSSAPGWLRRCVRVVLLWVARVVKSSCVVDPNLLPSSCRIGALGFASAVTPARGSYSASDTTVIAGVRGTDNRASGSGFGAGPGSGTIGSEWVDGRGVPSSDTGGS